MLITLARANSIADAIVMLRNALVRFNQAKAAGASDLGFLRFEVELDVSPERPLALLKAAKAQPHDKKLYWRAKSSQAQALCLGIAYDISDSVAAQSKATLSLLAPLLKKHPYIKLFGGTRFDRDSTPSAEWQSFGAFRFFLPAIEFYSDKDRATVACHLVAERAASTVQELVSCLDQVQVSAFLIDPSQTEAEGAKSARQSLLTPGPDGWQSSIQQAVAHITAKDLEKVVLARKRVYGLHDVSPFSLLERLRGAVYPAAYFCWQLDSKTAFLGASPELLYARVGQRINTEALAGTRKRGRGSEEDEALSKELFGSDKERHEHEIVVAQIADVLKRLCVDGGVRHQRGVIKLPNVQHLESALGGLLKTGLSDMDIVEALHPTASVCGLPSIEALRFIREHEGFDRGFYAGPFGMLSLDKSEFVVAIRSALMYEQDLHVFGGAGIVKGSESQSEWDETEHKMKPFLEIIGET